MTEMTTDRTKSIGGSDVAAILGISPFRTPLDVWREKLLGEEDEMENAAMVAGKRFEEPILRDYAKKLPHGSTVERIETVQVGYRRASVDAIARVNGWERIVEAKSTVFGNDWSDDAVPLHYDVQGTWYQDILEVDRCDYPFVVWPWEKRDLLGLTADEIVAKVEVQVRTRYYSQALAKHISEKVDEFWHEHVLTETPPPPVDLADIKRLVRVASGTYVAVTDELVQHIANRDALKARAKEIEKQIETEEFALRNAMGDAEAIVGPDGFPLLTLKRIDKKPYTVKAQSYREMRTTKHWTKLHPK